MYAPVDVEFLHEPTHFTNRETVTTSTVPTALVIPSMPKPMKMKTQKLMQTCHMKPNASNPPLSGSHSLC